MDHDCKVTIVILTHNRIDRCLNCVRHASTALRGVSGEILVINNGKRIQSFPKEVNGISCHIIQTGKNLGAGARNIALKATDSEYLLMIDDDAYFECDVGRTPGVVAEEPVSGAVRAMIDIFRDDPLIGAVAFKILCNNREDACLLPTVFHGCACGFRADALRAVGGYPEGFLYYGEEYHVAFRLYQAGYRIVASKGLGKVIHVQDSRGRDINRIIRLLIRNNISLWISMFPRNAVFSAVFDTLCRYMLIARKEKAFYGFMRACTALPITIIRGLRHRNPIRQDVFRSITLVQGVEKACGDILHDKSTRLEGKKPDVIVCGVGKFPSFWVEAMETHNINIVSFWDTNICWQNRKIRGVPAFVYPGMLQEKASLRDINDKNMSGKSISIVQTPFFDVFTYFLLGTSSLPETDFWRKQLFNLNLRRLHSPAGVESEDFASQDVFDLLTQSAVEVYKFPQNLNPHEDSEKTL